MTPLFKKLNFKDHSHIVAINSPQTFKQELQKMESTTHILTDTVQIKEIEFILCFVTTQSEIDMFISENNHKFIGDTIIWLCYPKASSKRYACEFNRDTGFHVLGNYNLEPVRQVSIDEDWSALRFRKVEYIKTIIRRESYALTNEAKKRTTQKGK
jgi:hypothetical protein